LLVVARSWSEDPREVMVGYESLIAGSAIVIIGAINLGDRSRHLEQKRVKMKAGTYLRRGNQQHGGGSSSASLGRRHLRSEMTHLVVSTQVRSGSAHL
jgi:hypothetical protein